MSQEIKVASPSSKALEALAQSLRQATSQAPATKPRVQADRLAAALPHGAPEPRSLSHGMTAPNSPALARAHVSAAWQPPPLDAPAVFRNSPTGHAWQMTHFEAVWQHLGPAPTPASISKARSFVAQRSKGVPSAELDAFVYDMRTGAESHQAYLVRLINLSSAHGSVGQAHNSLAQALCSELERTLCHVHEAVRDLFVMDLRKRAHLNIINLTIRS